MNAQGGTATGQARLPRRPHRVLGTLLAAVFASPCTLAASPPAGPGSLTAGLQTSDVRIGARNDTWRSQWLQWDRRDADSGLSAALERRTRDRGRGGLGRLGGYWLGRRWVVSGQIEAGSGAAFVPRRAAQVHVGLRLDPTHVVRAGYRQAAYQGSTLRLWSVSGLLYRGDDEWELGYRRGRLETPARRSIAFGVARGLWGCGSHWSCGARLAVGRNVFGADEPGLDTGTGWQAEASLAYRLDGGDRLRIDVGTGHASRFRQNTLSLSYHHAFGR